MQRRLGVFFAFLAFWTSHVVVGDDCPDVEARIITVAGLVEIQRSSTKRWLQAKPNDVLCRNDLLRSGANSKANILILEETRMALDERTTIRISATSDKTNTVFSNLIDLFAGEAYFRSRKARELNIETPIFNAMHEGTEFLVRVIDDQAQVIVFDGVVLASNQQGQVRVKQGQSAQASKGQAPVIGPRIELRDAVQWTLYYPPVIDYSDSGQLFTNSALQPILGQILNNDLTQAFKQLDAFPVTEQTAEYHTLYASLLLIVGQVDEALKHLNQIKQNSPRQAEALSLRSMIALAQNDQPKALKLAQQAEQINNTSPSSHIALSYIYQSQFDIDKALQSARQAAQAGPKNGLTWARVSELELATGNVDKSMQAANRAQQLNPRLSKTNTVLGFARLASLELSEAEQSFRDAIQRDPADPLARLGLGLAKIRQGHIKSGTRDMETAANLDPGNALIRSYLGKAYYEQRRGTIANTEYKIAKHLDPNDPTPWFYDAIYKQTVNRPVEALHDMQKAIELNDNRAVFRSKLLLDEDLAARSAALGRIYNDLGFQQRGLLEGWKAVNSDPGNYSAHRLLADNYAALPRHEIARVSSLLRSQLLQPINITPVQPQLSESNLLILDGSGPQTSSFNEFNPLYARNRLAIQASGVVGSNNTWGEELTHSGLWNKFSYSIGQYHYETKGFRENNDSRTDVFNIFTQFQISNKTSIQGEYRQSENKLGDQISRFFNDDFRPLLEQNREIKTGRVGFSHVLSPNSTIIGTIIYRDTKGLFNNNKDSLPSNAFELRFKEDSYLYELQHIYRLNQLNLISGVGHYTTSSRGLMLKSPFVPFPLENEKRNLRLTNLYLYSKIKLVNNLNLTIGVSADLFNGTFIKNNQVNPKFGLTWIILKNTIFRMAFFRNFNREGLGITETIEPVQIDGFVQKRGTRIIDNIENTVAQGIDEWRAGLALEHKFSSKLFVGTEFSQYQLRIPGQNVSQVNVNKFLEKSRENIGRAYIYSTPVNWFAASAEFFYERIDRGRRISAGFGSDELKTFRIPLSLRFYSNTGFSLTFRGTLFEQEGEFISRSFSSSNEKASFWIFDSSIQYRLPKRYGIISVGANNLLDKSSRFQESDTSLFRVQRGRFVFGRIKLAY